MVITLKDQVKKEYLKPITVYQVAGDISEGLAKNAVCGKVDGELVDLNYVIKSDCSLQIITLKDPEGMEVYRHTSSHILAQAVKRLYKDVKLAIGPAIENGFYYDFDFLQPISQDDFEKIEKEIKKICDENLPIERFELPYNEAIALMNDLDEPYKIEIISELPADSVISFYKQGEYVDLCRGPHFPSTGKVKVVKLTSITGAYWRGSEKNKMLTRIYGTSFEKKSQLDAYLEALEDAKRRDHNKLGRELGFFMTDEKVGQGLPLLMPKGAKTIQILQRFIEDEEERRGYLLTKTPYMAKSDLYKMSGHWDHYKDGMFVLGDEEKDDEVLALRPMTCPFQFTIYNNGLKSYKDLPIRYNETSTLFRNENSGEMHGLIRVRQFTLSEGHIVCTPEQIESEFASVMDLIYYVMKCIGLDKDVTYRFSRWDPANTEKYIDDPQAWENTENLMRNILNHLGIKYVEAIGEAAFYGPKLDVQAKNVYGKEDTLFTVQVDFALGERLNMNYIDADGVKKHPYVIHRSSLGCYERTLAMLIEKYAGALPLWMSATQVKVLALTDRTTKDALKITEKLNAKGIRAQADVRGEKIGYKIREAQLDKIPFMIIIGDKEKAEKTVSIRSRKSGDMGSMKLNDFIKMVVKLNNDKDLTV